MIILFGLAGSGKSTQGRILAEDLGWEWLSVGQVLRENGQFNEILQRGELVNDEIAIDLMQNEMKRVWAEGKDAVLDGYPRDVAQAEWIVKNWREQINCTIFIKVDKNELWERIKLRARADDTEEVVRRRFEIVEQNICSILELLRGAGVPVSEIDGNGTIEEVAERIKEKING